jgi:hypothetical protein
MTAPAIAIPDPRSFPDPSQAPAGAAALYAQADASLAADTALRSAELDAALRSALAALLAGDGALLAATMAGAPSVAVARHLWRLLDDLGRKRDGAAEGEVAATLFALPVVIVAGVAGDAGSASLPGTLPAPDRLAALLRDGGALAGNQTFALADALASVDAIDLPHLPRLLSWQALPEAVPGGGRRPAAHALPPAPIALAPGVETVNLRFLVGTAIAKAGADLCADATVGKWGIPFTQELGRQLQPRAGAVTVLALPRAPQRLLPAVQQGRAAQREVGAAVFVGNALRRLRAAAGEPTAVISAHRAPGVPGGGELRLSLSSPFDPRDAEGFRCPLHPLDRVGDVARMLVELLRDCRVADVRVLAGVHADRDPATGLRLLFKPGTMPAHAEVLLH